jgi:Rrf2 family transcriptional regulator, cysteine metabolism repressor
MKLSTKCRYGLRALIDLAVYSESGHVALHEIAARQDISLKYLEQDFSVLRRAGIIKSVKGAQGGYMLTKAPSEIHLSEIVDVLEGDLLLIEIEDSEKTDIRSFLNRNVWGKLNANVKDVLETIRLSDLAEEYIQSQSGKEMYYI